MSEASSGALAGIKVIDLSRVLGGPYCTQMLGDHGAEIIKVEPPQGDETRTWGPPFQGDAASYFIGVNRNKRGIVLDLSKPQGREVLFRLLDGADVLVENFKTGTLEKWGMGYEDVLKARFPRLIHCRVSGFGADGPLGGYPGYDAVVQGMAGLMSVNGEPDGAPVRVGVPVVDLATGMNATIAILMAVIERARSGKGQFVEERSTTAPSPSSTRISPISSSTASRRFGPATRIPMSAPTISSGPAPSASSSASATTGNSPGCAPRSAIRSSRPIRASRAMATASPTARHCASCSRRRSPPSMEVL